jgi:hypothetical protein
MATGSTGLKSRCLWICEPLSEGQIYDVLNMSLVVLVGVRNKLHSRPINLVPRILNVQMVQEPMQQRCQDDAGGSKKKHTAEQGIA